MITREEAKKILLESVQKEIKKHGEDAIALMSPCIGKCSWTWKEYKDAVENDTNLENTSMNPIDTYLRYVAWKEKRNEAKE